MPTVNIHRETGKALTSTNVYRAVKMDLRSKCALQNHMCTTESRGFSKRVLKNTYKPLKCFRSQDSSTTKWDKNRKKKIQSSLDPT